MDNVRLFRANEPGARVDKFIAGRCPEMSRTHVQRLIADGCVKVNGAVAKSGIKLFPGDKVEFAIPPPATTTLCPESISLKIIYEDDDLIVLDKPAGLTVHPAPGHPGGTLVNAVLAHFPALGEVDDSVRPGIVHRLDKDTSGLMIIAKTKAAQMNLVAQFKARTVAKTYQVLVKGRLAPERGIIEAAIGRSRNDRKRMTVVTDGQDAITDYTVTRYIGNYTLLEAHPRTGRTHQIRVHFSAIGFPVVGDAVYGAKSEYLSRQFLHAARLGFKLPSSGKDVEFTSPLPPDLEETLKQLSSGQPE